MKTKNKKKICKNIENKHTSTITSIFFRFQFIWKMFHRNLNRAKLHICMKAAEAKWIHWYIDKLETVLKHIYTQTHILTFCLFNHLHFHVSFCFVFVHRPRTIEPNSIQFSIRTTDTSKRTITTNSTPYTSFHSTFSPR